MAERGIQIDASGLRDLRRDLRRIAPEVGKQLDQEFMDIAEDIATRVRPQLVRRTGEYAASVRAYKVQGGATIGSRLPQAGVLHWGGTIRPRGADITFPARPVISETVEANADEIVEAAGEVVDRAARRAGWRGSTR